MKYTAVIMAGGRGERFWPKSRNDMPKQFLSLFGDGKSMLQLTVERVSSLVSIEDVFVVTNQTYFKIVKEQLPSLPIENILAEPAAKNTAPAIGLAAAVIQKKYGDSIMIVLPSDHLIKQPLLFIDVLKTAINVAMENTNLVTIGITPNYPETGYGYIKFGHANYHENHSNVYHVEKFVEKPDIEMAKQYIKSGNYLWNSGMFVWKTSSILNNFKKYMKETYVGLIKIGDAYKTNQFENILLNEFIKFKSVSIDYGIMEVASDIFTIPSSFGWDDVGSWLALERIISNDNHGNAIQGNVVSVDSKNMIILGGKKLIATVGLDDIIIVDTDDVLLVCSKNEAQNVKSVIEALRNQNKTKYL